jgi:thiol-disulfide isomerase/thioredoxin
MPFHRRLSQSMFVLGMVLLAGVNGLALPVTAATGDQLIMFTASWCATCRDLMPVVERIVSEHALPLVLVDVDEPKAPKTSKQLGLAIPTKELPQLYILHANKTSSLLFDGETYVLGQRRAAQIEIQDKFNKLNPTP